WHVPEKQIIGGVVMAPRYLGYVITFITNPWGLGSIVLVILVIWMIWKLTRAPPSESERDERHARRSSRKSASEDLEDQPDGIIESVRTEVLVGEGDMQDEPSWGLVTHDERRPDLLVTLVGDAEQPTVPVPDDHLALLTEYEPSEAGPADETVEEIEAELAVASEVIEQSPAQPDL